MHDRIAIRCPFCDAASAELISLFGSQLLLSQYRCGACRSYFEGIREDRLRGLAGLAGLDAEAPRETTSGDRAEH